MTTETLSAPPTEALKCAECGTRMEPGTEHEVAGEQTFCMSCYNNLRAQMEQAIAQQSTDVNYPMGFLGALLGGAVGTLAWWGFTVLTEIQLGLIAIVIGFAAGKGAVLFTGGKRSRGLQILSVLTTSGAFVYASYLVNRTFIQQSLAEGGEAAVLSWFPDPGTLFSIVGLNFGMFEVLFLGIAVYEAWKIPAPVKILKNRA